MKPFEYLNDSQCKFLKILVNQNQHFVLSPPIMEYSLHVPITFVPQKNSKSSLYHILKGFYDLFILAKNKRGKTNITNRRTPCSYVSDAGLQAKANCHYKKALTSFLVMQKCCWTILNHAKQKIPKLWRKSLILCWLKWKKCDFQLAPHQVQWSAYGCQ